MQENYSLSRPIIKLNFDNFINTHEGIRLINEYGIRSYEFQNAKMKWYKERKNNMNNMQVFENNEFGKIRTVEENGVILFCGKDVAEILGYSRTADAIRTFCKGVCEIPTPTNGGVQKVKFIPESDLYRLIINSKLPSAEKFERWVMEEVLPSIRKHGGYVQGQEEMRPEELMAKAVLYADSKIKELQGALGQAEIKISYLEVDNQKLQPKADYFDELVERNLLTNFRDTAKQLGVGEKNFIQFLLDRKYVYRNKKGKLNPYAEKGDGLFEVKEYYNESNRFVGTQTLITPKGKEVFRLLTKGL